MLGIRKDKTDLARRSEMITYLPTYLSIYNYEDVLFFLLSNHCIFFGARVLPKFTIECLLYSRLE